MNKYITLLLLGVLAAAMLLVIFVHMNASSEDSPASAPSVSGSDNADAAPPASAAEGGASDNSGGVTPAPSSSGSASTSGDATATDGVAANTGASGGALGGSETGTAPSANAANTASPENSESTPSDTGGVTPAPSASGGTSASGTSGNAPASSASTSGRASTNVGASSASQAAAPGAASNSAAPSSQGRGADVSSVPLGQGSIKDLSFHFKDKGMILRIEGDGPLPAKYFVLSQPERLVIDLPGSWNGLNVPDIPSNNLVRAVRIGRQGNADRLVLDLHVPAGAHDIIRINDSKVEVYFQQ